MSRSSFRFFETGLLKRRWLRPQASRAQLLVRWTAAFAYLILALGIPLPLPAGKVSGQPYPCMNHRCGCQSAEECWRNCCCMTLEERLIWARENHVRPPDFALAEARAQGIQWAMYWPDEPNQQGSTQCVAIEPTAEQSACPEPSGRCPCCKPAVSECPCCACQHCASKATCQEKRSVSGVLLVEALKCHGVGENWQGLVISLPPPAMVQFHFPDEIVQRLSFSSLHLSMVSFSPAVPPPRLLIAANCLS